ncbi:VOC family protein [Planotetraspora sp. A-T 1434]|uniref:VOC family protein n=1 Tax=Planotetraspora sp. A-T 1434 TaxID=2979219 RepID=UPI0021BFDC5F|nr:VOC family protein [Planotetraspora sp. A-T 1434]MCT9933792.1 VOC family protein [Planotetraspora sp. A-T 1434]
MSLHRLTDITLGVPNVEETVEYYTTYGLIPQEPVTPGEHWFGTVDGGPRQLRIVETPVRRLLAVGIGADDQDDLGRIAESLKRFDVASDVDGDRLTTTEPVTGLTVTVSVAPHIRPKPAPDPHLPNHRARSVLAMLADEPVRPRKLGHVFLGSTDAETTQRFFTDGIGFKVSDEVRNAATFMRCSTDHHNLVVGASPVNYLHHSSWEVADVDSIGRAAKAVLEGHPERHTWGFGRLAVGSNYFYYLRDPAGNQCEYYCGMDEITDDQVWEPGVFEVGAVWGPPIAPSLIKPDDLAELMAGSH